MSQHSLLPSTITYQINRRKNHPRFVADVMLVMLSYILAANFTNRTLQQVDVLIISGMGMGWYFSSKLTDLYNEFRTVTFIDEILALLPNLLTQFIILVVSLFFLKDYDYTRSFTLAYVAVLGANVVFKMYSTRKLVRFWNLKGVNQRNLVIVGEMNQVDGFRDLVQRNPQFGYTILGAWGYKEAGRSTPPLLETIDFLNETALGKVIDELVIAPSQFEESYVKGIITWADKKGILVRFTPGFFQFSASRYSLELFGNYPLITVRSTPLEMDSWWMLKRAFDVLFSAVFLVLVASWLFPLIALAIRWDSRGPVFFVQDRWGQRGRNIGVWKFRTMYHNASTVRADGGFNQTTQDDPRITKVGRFLRKTNLDELPQFINVLLGTMSVVGPRPHAVKHSLETLPKIDNYMIRHRLKPGITGWAQVNGFRGETQEIGLMRKRVDYDIWYIENWSLVLDFQIVLRTAYNMVKGDPKAF
ncbi:exopolysaccharide biosynthesis polyprenyl glycosylphosphotransferase [Runella sp. CRIBMP]|uniref:exopolysaccharide biosynthesis polyprenyl glycosylphosphotransferase n=1 Tax=Runella sp. CRIBMP TaxID=2683261 RepID=UPI001412F16D|nr:exopolysaccharide biosynthesis polyprenyl glycosylphosphotransferase [Runella sp. CRIBMP]NBB22820.1 exopolysaccharide biosynthesis polyprenyl glycosylphosphotransferase [Runella sp. CRIBMP]